MGARSGDEYIAGLREARTHVQIGGETLTGGVADHPAFRNVVRSYAALFDMQGDPELRDTLTYESPSSGERVGTSFMVPRTPADLVQRRRAMKLWADRSLGTLGRTGDYLNSCLMALSEAGPWFAQADPAFGENARRYYEHVRENDLLTTHTLITPQAQPRPGRRAAARRRARRAHRLAGRQRRRDPRRAHARHDRADRRRAHRDALDGAQGQRGGRAVLLRVRDPVRHEGAALHLPRVVRLRRVALRPPARLALRGDGRGRDLRRRPRPVRALLPARAPRAVQRDLRRHDGGRAHDPPGRDARHRQDGGDPRRRLAALRGDRRRGLPARAGEHRGGHGRARDHRRARPQRRGPGRAQPVRRADAEMGAAQRVPATGIRRPTSGSPRSSASWARAA